MSLIRRASVAAFVVLGAATGVAPAAGAQDQPGLIDVLFANLDSADERVRLDWDGGVAPAERQDAAADTVSFDSGPVGVDADRNDLAWSVDGRVDLPPSVGERLVAGCGGEWGNLQVVCPETPLDAAALTDVRIFAFSVSDPIATGQVSHFVAAGNSPLRPDVPPRADQPANLLVGDEQFLRLQVEPNGTWTYGYFLFDGRAFGRYRVNTIALVGEQSGYFIAAAPELDWESFRIFTDSEQPSGIPVGDTTDRATLFPGQGTVLLEPVPDEPADAPVAQPQPAPAPVAVPVQVPAIAPDTGSSGSMTPWYLVTAAGLAGLGAGGLLLWSRRSREGAAAPITDPGWVEVVATNERAMNAVTVASQAMATDMGKLYAEYGKYVEHFGIPYQAAVSGLLDLEEMKRDHDSRIAVAQATDFAINMINLARLGVAGVRVGVRGYRWIKGRALPGQGVPAAGAVPAQAAPAVKVAERPLAGLGPMSRPTQPDNPAIVIEEAPDWFPRADPDLEDAFINRNIAYQHMADMALEVGADLPKMVAARGVMGAIRHLQVLVATRRGATVVDGDTWSRLLSIGLQIRNARDGLPHALRTDDLRWFYKVLDANEGAVDDLAGAVKLDDVASARSFDEVPPAFDDWVIDGLRQLADEPQLAARVQEPLTGGGTVVLQQDGLAVRIFGTDAPVITPVISGVDNGLGIAPIGPTIAPGGYVPHPAGLDFPVGIPGTRDFTVGIPGTRDFPAGAIPDTGSFPIPGTRDFPAGTIPDTGYFPTGTIPDTGHFPIPGTRDFPAGTIPDTGYFPIPGTRDFPAGTIPDTTYFPAGTIPDTGYFPIPDTSYFPAGAVGLGYRPPLGATFPAPVPGGVLTPDGAFRPVGVMDAGFNDTATFIDTFVRPRPANPANVGDLLAPGAMPPAQAADLAGAISARGGSAVVTGPGTQQFLTVLAPNIPTAPLNQVWLVDRGIDAMIIGADAQRQLIERPSDAFEVLWGGGVDPTMPPIPFEILGAAVDLTGDDPDLVWIGGYDPGGLVLVDLPGLTPEMTAVVTPSGVAFTDPSVPTVATPDAPVPMGFGVGLPLGAEQASMRTFGAAMGLPSDAWFDAQRRALVTKGESLFGVRSPDAYLDDLENPDIYTRDLIVGAPGYYLGFTIPADWYIAELGHRFTGMVTSPVETLLKGMPFFGLHSIAVDAVMLYNKHYYGYYSDMGSSVHGARFVIGDFQSAIARHGVALAGAATQLQQALDGAKAYGDADPGWKAENGDAFTAKVAHDEETLQHLQQSLTSLESMSTVLAQLEPWLKELLYAPDGSSKGMYALIDPTSLIRMTSSFLAIGEALGSVLLVTPPPEAPPATARPPIKDFDEWRNTLPPAPEMYPELTDEERAEADRQRKNLGALGTGAWPGGPGEPTPNGNGGGDPPD